jgi:hypothetical protein
VLTDEDRTNIRAFKLKMVANMPRSAFNHMRHAFRHNLDISSEYAILHRMAILSEIVPEWYDCCPGSCIAYTGRYASLDECPCCNQPRRSQTGRARRVFCYLPLIPRLQGFFANPHKIEELSYRHDYVPREGSISDVFDGNHYRGLL